MWSAGNCTFLDTILHLIRYQKDYKAEREREREREREIELLVIDEKRFQANYLLFMVFFCFHES
jgi:hypothetical protein